MKKSLKTSGEAGATAFGRIPALMGKAKERLLPAALAILTICSLLSGCILLIGCAGSPETMTRSSDAPIPYADAIGEGVVAPDFSYTTIDGTSSQLSAHRGSVVLMNLWASWCGPCIAEMPDIDQLRQQNPELVVLAINVSEDPADARDYIQETGYDFTWILDEKGEIGSLYPTDGIPYTIIIDKAGTISSIYLGSPRNPLETYGEALQKAGI